EIDKQSVRRIGELSECKGRCVDGRGIRIVRDVRGIGKPSQRIVTDDNVCVRTTGESDLEISRRSTENQRLRLAEGEAEPNKTDRPRCSSGGGHEYIGVPVAGGQVVTGNR